MAANFLGYGIWADLSEFMRWHGDCAAPVVGTVNQVLGLNENTETKNYTNPKPHPDADYQLTEAGWPYGESQTAEKRVYAAIDTDCPESLRPATLYTYEQIDVLGFMPTFYQARARPLWSRMVSWFTG